MGGSCLTPRVISAHRSYIVPIAHRGGWATEASGRRGIQPRSTVWLGMDRHNHADGGAPLSLWRLPSCRASSLLFCPYRRDSWCYPSGRGSCGPSPRMTSRGHRPGGRAAGYVAQRAAQRCSARPAGLPDPQDARLQYASTTGCGRRTLLQECGFPPWFRTAGRARLAARSCYIGSSSKISTAHFPSLLDRNGRPSVNAFAAARSSASTIV